MTDRAAPRVLKARSTLRWEAGRFLRWRKARGGAVKDLRELARGGNYDRTWLNARGRDHVEVDVMFARNERQGRYA